MGSSSVMMLRTISRHSRARPTTMTGMGSGWRRSTRTARQRSSSATILKALIPNRNLLRSPLSPPQPSLPYKAYLPVVSKGGISFEPITARPRQTCNPNFARLLTFMVVKNLKSMGMIQMRPVSICRNKTKGLLFWEMT